MFLAAVHTGQAARFRWRTQRGSVCSSCLARPRSEASPSRPDSALLAARKLSVYFRTCRQLQPKIQAKPSQVKSSQVRPKPRRAKSSILQENTYRIFFCFLCWVFLNPSSSKNEEGEKKQTHKQTKRREIENSLQKYAPRPKKRQDGPATNFLQVLVGWSDWSRPADKPHLSTSKKHHINTLRSRATAPADLEPPKSVGGLEVGLGLRIYRVGDRAGSGVGLVWADVQV